MYKLKVFLEKHIFKLGVLLIILGIALLHLNYTESKVGINTDYATISKTCDMIDGLGNESKLILYQNKDVTNLYQLMNSSKISDARIYKIENNFKVGENMLRGDMYLFSLIFMVFSLNIGFLIILSHSIKSIIDNYILKQKLSQAISKITNN